MRSGRRPSPEARRLAFADTISPRMICPVDGPTKGRHERPDGRPEKKGLGSWVFSCIGFGIPTARRFPSNSSEPRFYAVGDGIRHRRNVLQDSKPEIPPTNALAGFETRTCANRGAISVVYTTTCTTLDCALGKRFTGKAPAPPLLVARACCGGDRGPPSPPP